MNTKLLPYSYSYLSESPTGGVTLAYKGGVPTLKILQQSSNDELGPELRAWHERCRKITWLSSIII
jgi:hypothetical protein